MAAKQTKPNRTKEVIEEMIDKFANSEKLINLFKEYQTTRTLFNHDVEKYELLAKYALAREFHGDGFNDEIEAIKEDLKKNKIEANAARVLIDTIKWQAAKFYPKMYGEKLDITTGGEKIGGVIKFE